jgi:hypothetical protein
MLFLFLFFFFLSPAVESPFFGGFFVGFLVEERIWRRYFLVREAIWRIMIWVLMGISKRDLWRRIWRSRSGERLFGYF